MNTASRNTSRRAKLITGLAVISIASVAMPFSSKSLYRTEAATPERTVAANLPLSFTDSGQLLQPSGYRRWVYVGAPLTPNDMNNGKAAFPEFHSVYINPEALDEYEKTGIFPDGTVLVKELISVGSKAATSGKGYFMGDFQGLEVAVKDKARFKDEPGNWAYFSFGHEYPLKEKVKAQPVANCSTCHGASGAQDFVFTQYYPVLRHAKKSTARK